MRTAVLMATFNGAMYLTNQLDSIRKQELPPDSVIFRDDGSTDDTVALLERYIAEYQLKNWVIKQNTTNLGWRLNFRQLLLDAQELNADIIFLSDQDDLWKTDKNRVQAETMQLNPQIELLSGDIEVKKLTDDATVPTYFKFSNIDQRISIYPPRNLYQSFRSGWTLALRSSFAQQVLAYWKPDYQVTHDVVLEVLASLTGTGYNLNKIVGTHLRHSGNASGSGIIALSDSKEKDVTDLYKMVGFYDIIHGVLSDRHSPIASDMKNYLSFSRDRYRVARSNHALKQIIFVLTHWRYYFNMSGRIRDFFFAFKKIKSTAEEV